MLTLLHDANVYAPEPLGRVDLLLAGNRCVWAGPADEAPQGRGIARVDLGGRRVIPALVDPHVHVTGGGGESGYGSRVAPLPVAAYRRAGIGTAVGVLGTDDTTRTTASLVAWTRQLAAHGVAAYCLTGGYHLPPTTLTGGVRSDITFVDPVIGVGEVAISDHRSSQPTTAELLRVAADAHVAGLMTGKAGILHLHVGDGAAGLEPVRACLAQSELPARVFNPTHVNRRRALFDEAVELAAGGSWIDITAFPVGPDEDAWSAERALGIILDQDESGAAAGVAQRVTVSSDAGGCLPVFDPQGQVVDADVARPEAVLECLQALLAEGRPLERVLPAFTTNAARLLRLSTRGWLGAGSDSDLLVLGEHGDAAIDASLLGGAWYNGAGEPHSDPSVSYV